MKITFSKINVSNHELKIVRADETADVIILDTKTYLLHDVCHFYVEKELKTLEGFWGMLSQGYQISELFGKTNQLTEKLRAIERIVGGTQSVYSKHMSETEFWNYIQSAVGYDFVDKKFFENVIPQITKFMNEWKYLPIGQTSTLQF